MALEKAARPLARGLICTCHERTTMMLQSRSFGTTGINLDELDAISQKPEKQPLNPLTVASPRAERKLFRERRLMPIGSRRRRAAMKTTPSIPFAQLPFQCFQEARAFLLEDRAEKLDEIRVQRERMQRVRELVADGVEAETKREMRLRSMRRHLDELKILADINDPLVKKKFEDGQGDMSKPIYRHLADLKWRSYERKIVIQRLEQMTIVPDVLPYLDPIVSTRLAFAAAPSTMASRKKYKNVPHGDFVDSRLSESAPILHIQPYTAGEQLVTVAVINPDVPNVEKDGFDYRCHYLACNIPVSAIKTSVDLGRLENEVVMPWYPAYSQKGIPYQRMAVIILAQPPSQQPSAVTDTLPQSRVLKVDEIKTISEGKYGRRENFSLRAFVDRFKLQPIGMHLFRTQHDEGTPEVMQRLGAPGWDVEFKRKRIDPLPYKRLKSERYR